MKKTLIIVFLCLVGLNARSQEWSETEIKADPLKGVNQAYTSYVYDNPHVGGFVHWSNSDEQYKLYCYDGIFDLRSSSYSRGQFVKIGLYDESENLVEMIEMWLITESGKSEYLHTVNAGVMNNPVGQKKKSQKIFDFLNNRRGYVRFVCPRYGKSDFDLKVPCKQNPPIQPSNGIVVEEDTAEESDAAIVKQQDDIELTAEEMVAFSDLFAQIDFFVNKLNTEIESYDVFGKQRTYLSSGDRKYSVAPMGRLINVKIEEVVADSEYDRLLFILTKYFEGDSRVNEVYKNNAGTLMVDCRK